MTKQRASYRVPTWRRHESVLGKHGEEKRDLGKIVALDPDYRTHRLWFLWQGLTTKLDSDLYKLIYRDSKRDLDRPPYEYQEYYFDVFERGALQAGSNKAPDVLGQVTTRRLRAPRLGNSWAIKRIELNGAIIYELPGL